MKPLYEAALRVLKRKDIDDDTRAVAQCARGYAAPTIDEKRGKWIDR